jgi:hypothetical protein
MIIKSGGYGFVGAFFHVARCSVLLQHILVCFQQLELTVGTSTRHGRDMQSYIRREDDPWAPPIVRLPRRPKQCPEWSRTISINRVTVIEQALRKCGRTSSGRKQLVMTISELRNDERVAHLFPRPRPKKTDDDKLIERLRKDFYETKSKWWNHLQARALAVGLDLRVDGVRLST